MTAQEQQVTDFVEAEDLADVIGAIEVIGRVVRERRERAHGRLERARIYSPLLDKPDSEVAYVNGRATRVRITRPHSDLEEILLRGMRERGRYHHSAMSVRLRSSGRYKPQSRREIWPALTALLLILLSIMGLTIVAFTERPEEAPPTSPNPIDAGEMLLFGGDDQAPAGPDRPKTDSPLDGLHAEGSELPEVPKARAKGPKSRSPGPDPVARAFPRKSPRRHVFFVSTSS